MKLDVQENLECEIEQFREPDIEALKQSVTAFDKDSMALRNAKDPLEEKTQMEINEFTRGLYNKSEIYREKMANKYFDYVRQRVENRLNGSLQANEDYQAQKSILELAAALEVKQSL